MLTWALVHMKVALELDRLLVLKLAKSLLQELIHSRNNPLSFDTLEHQHINDY